MYYLYNVLIYLAAPVAILVQLWRGLRDPSYRGSLSERLGFGARVEGPTIWLHAVSVGEVQASQALVAELQKRHPRHRILMTTVTPTGAARVRLLFGDQVQHRYVPLDLPGAVKRFFDRVQPALAMILETELWPNLYGECGRRGVPLVLASARISPRSVGKYRRLVPLFRMTLSHGIVIAAQSESDAARFLSIGAAPDRTYTTGNIKFDFQPPAGIAEAGRRWRERHAPGRAIWVAGSTHEGEEAAVLDAHLRVLERVPDALLVLVPRHPQRFDAVRELLAKRRERSVYRSSGEAIAASTRVLLGDTMGELLTFYAAADAAFVAGSLVPVGGHNLLEPASVGCPVITGPHNFNGEEIARLLVDSGAARVVADAGQLAGAVTDLFRDPGLRAEMGGAGKAVLDANRGALDRLLTLVDPLLG